MNIWQQDIVVKDSRIPGNTTTIMVWVHGNELAWPIALREIMSYIEVVSGKVNFIFANLKALEQNKRFVEMNMNRCFFNWQNGLSYEQQRVAQILPYLDESDLLLDCHNTTNTHSSVPMFLWENSEYAQYFDTSIMVTWFDGIQPGSSDGYMYQQWKVGICL